MEIGLIAYVLYEGMRYRYEALPQNSLTFAGLARMLLLGPGLEAMNCQPAQARRLWRTPIPALCGLVFFFALHAKIAVYNGGAPVKVTPSTATKLWLKAQKPEVLSLDSSSSALPWMTVPCVWNVYLQRERRVLSAFPPPRSNKLALCHLHPFLRPPPVQA